MSPSAPTASPTPSTASWSDSALRDECVEAIRRVGAFPHVSVMVTHGWAALSGAVPSPTDRWRLEAALGRVEGLSGASGQLVVAPRVQ